MTRRIVSVLFLVAFLPLAFSFKNPPALKKGVQTIIIDPGHGGKDQGAKGAATTEAKICLEIGLKLGEEIKQRFPEIKILYTRTTDIIPGNKPDKSQGLRYRAEFANQSGGDLFIAIHANSAPAKANRVRTGYKYVGKGSKRRKVATYRTTYTPNPAYGTETFIWAADENSHKGDMIKMEEGEYGESDSTLTMPDINDPMMKAFQLLYAKKYFENSLQFAGLIESEFIKQGRVSRGVKQRNDVGIWVLHATGMPSVLVETGFLSNKEEESYLISDKGQDEIVKNISDALGNYILAKEKAPASNGNNNSPDTKSAKTGSAILNKNNNVKTGSK